MTLYLEAPQHPVLGKTLSPVRVASPFGLRTAVPPLESIEGRPIRALRRVGKRIVFGFEDELWLVIHLMIAGRLHWQEPGAKLSHKIGLVALDFANGTLLLTE